MNQQRLIMANFLPIRSLHQEPLVHTTVWIHHLNISEVHEEKPTQNSYAQFWKNLRSYILKTKQMYGHLPSISLTIKVKPKRLAGEKSTYL